MQRSSILLNLLAFSFTLSAQTPTPEIRKALQLIQPAELKGDLSFLASDLLQGRYTPSPGLEIAAEFIASKFRSIGLESGGTSGYFQLARMIDRNLPRVITPLIAHDGNLTITVEPAKIHLISSAAASVVANAPVIKISEPTLDKLRQLNLTGKIVLVAANSTTKAIDSAIGSSGALMEIVATRYARLTFRSALLFAEDPDISSPTIVQVESADLADAIDTPAKLTLSLNLPNPEIKEVTARNVIGVLRGSDPTLQSTCVLLTAHYDHIGTTDTAAELALSEAIGGDKIFNGANDDGSGTVSVIAVARALAQVHPKRSIVFIAFFGEERGLLGSTYYASHPLFPISKTIADLNLEQLGRTDSSEGAEIANASVTGYSYSNVTKYLEDAGKATGIQIYEDKSGTDDYFVRSDNAALAEQGVPAHTVTTALEFPDYHAVGDEWQKIDYENMANVDRAIALAVLNLADALKAPAWNADNPKTERFREAQQKPTDGTTPPRNPYTQPRLK